MITTFLLSFKTKMIHIHQTELYRELLQSKLSKQTAFVDFSLYCYEQVPNQYPSSYVQVTLQLLDLCYI